MKTQVFIVGGGVAGLTVALKLVKRGIDVIMVEKSPHLGHAYKGELIQPKTIQLFERAGIYESFSTAWTTFSTIETSELNAHLQPMLRSSMDYKQLPAPFQYAAMLPHSDIKRLLLKEVKQYDTFTLLQPATFEKMEENRAFIKQGKQKRTVAFDFIIGAEGVNSRVREQAGIERKRHVYEHDFLTVSFPAPDVVKHGHLIATKDRFLGLFPLPNGYVRTVYLIRKGEYKAWRKEPLQLFYDHYVSLFPALDGHVQTVKEWRAIQLMVPIRQHANHYVKDNIALIGDAAHSVHPMAGEGMNLAIQGADCLGELLIDLYEKRKGNEFLTHYESVHRKRVKAIMNLSHLGGLAYGKEGKAWQRSRTFALKQLLNNETLLAKYLFNISGLGFWPFSVKDSVTLVKRSKTTRVVNQMEQYQYGLDDDYPWRQQMR